MGTFVTAHFLNRTHHVNKALIIFKFWTLYNRMFHLFDKFLRSFMKLQDLKKLDASPGFGGETSRDGSFHPSPVFCYSKTTTAFWEWSYQSSWFQKFPWLYYRITYYQFSLFVPLWSGESSVYSLSFGSKKCEILSPHVRKSNAKHMPFKV